MLKTLVQVSSLLIFCIAPLAASGQTAAANSATNAPPLRVAIAGLVHGHAEGFFHQFKDRPDIQIVGIAEPERQLFERYAKKYALNASLWHADLDEMLRATNPQAVLAYTNTYDHRRVVEVCAKRGVHVMMEKPLAVSYEDAVAIESAARAGKIQVLVNYETTWYRSNRAAYNLVHQGAIGAIRKVVVRDGHNGPKEIGVSPEFLGWLTDPKLNGGGALFDFGCYGADLMTWLMDGRRPDNVTAVTQHLKPEIYPHVDDDATVVVKYPNAEAILQPSWDWPFDVKDMAVYGQSGYVITVRRDNIRVRLPSPDEENLRTAEPVPAPEDDPISYLRGVILGGLKPAGPSSLETNLIVTEILDAARRSAASGTTIRLAKE